MFEKLVVSSSQKRRGRTAKFFVCTSFVYLSLAGFAFALSVLLAAPKLADTAATGLRPIWPVGGATQKPIVGPKNKVTPTSDLRRFQTLDRIISNLGNSQPAVKQAALPPGTERIGAFDIEGSDGGAGPPGGLLSTGGGLSPGNVTTDPPKPPDTPKPQPRQADKAKPLAVSSTVLQGKAINRMVPIYPELARRIRLHGEVSTEVIISPEGRVESVRAVSGHPLLVQAAIDAARRWRFEPTILNNVPVRVTGVITFVFKLND